MADKNDFIERLSGPSHNIGWTQDNTPERNRVKVSLVLEEGLKHVEKIAALTYKMARLMRNTDEIPTTRWAVQCGSLLDELMSLDLDRYEREVKSPAK